MSPKLEKTLIDVELQERGHIEFDPEPARPAVRARWPALAIMILGTWLLTNPFTMGYRSQAMIASDLTAGLLLLMLGAISLKSPRVWPHWANGCVGVWLLFAPLLFWTPDPVAYDSNTAFGVLVIVFSLVLPSTPGEEQSSGPEIPPGWNYNPSAWTQRLPVIAMAFIGFFIARYLAAYQLGYIRTVWDPFFGDGTRRVLESDVSRAFPISDAGLGAISYLLEALTGFIGSTRRWRTMPWMVLLFGFMVVPLGAVSIVLVILQPLAVGAWCTLCLLTALAMLLMISPAADEVIATSQFLYQTHRDGKPFWRTVWKGGPPPLSAEKFWKGAAVEAISVGRTLPTGPVASLTALLGISHVTWTLIASAGLGIWLMLAPSVLETFGPAANSDHLVGALVITFSVIALGEVGRSLRWLNVLSGVWLIAAPWILSGGVGASQWNNLLVGVALIGLSIPRGRVEESYGTFNRYIV